MSRGGNVRQQTPRPTPRPGALLQQMNIASQSLNYELPLSKHHENKGVESLRLSTRTPDIASLCAHCYS
ncbi:hypothetical protein KCP75_13830 [Salmonella enterica subsp. enterica]|nr:hypothetical protein KCP75_13830 [Salmonella enterica subsp. enterica]